MIGVDPLNEDIVYACTNTGVYKSIDGGLTWEIIRGGLLFGDARSIVIDPFNPDFICVGFYNEGIYKSTDGGNSWTEANEGLINTHVGAMAISHTYDTNPLIFTGVLGNGLYRSVDNCSSWVYIGLDSSFITSIIMDPMNESILYVGASEDGIFKSTDAGSTWVTINNGMVQSPIGNYDIYSLVLNPDTTSIIYSGCDGFIDTNSIYKSIDGGENWIVLSPAFLIVKSLVISPVNTNIIYAGTYMEGVLKSIDGGLHWVPMNNIDIMPSGYVPNVSTLTMVPTNPELFFTGIEQEGVFKSEDSGFSWRPARQGISNGYCYELTIDKNLPNRIYASVGLYLWRSIDGGISWRNAGNLWANTLAIDPNNSNVIFAGTSNFVGTGNIMKSTDGGDSWTSVWKAKIDVLSLCIDPEYSNRIYAGCGYGIIRSMDGGLDWQEIGLGNVGVKCVSIDPDSTHIVYAGTDNGIFKSVDYGSVWNHFTLSGKLVWTIEIDPTNSNILYAVAVEEGIFKSKDKGKNWIALNKGLGNSMITSIAIDESNPNKLFIGTGGEGVYYSGNAGSNWAEMNMGLVNSYVNAVKLHPERRDVVYIATGGSGVLEYIMTETSIENPSDTESVSNMFVLSHNYPNPFNPSTTIRYVISKPSFVSLKIYDLLGREVETLTKTYQPAGMYEIRWTGENVPNGLYLYQLKAGNSCETKKFIIAR